MRPRKPLSVAFALFCALALLPGIALAQTGNSDLPSQYGNEQRPLALNDFVPKSMLQVEEHHLSRARFPVVDVHTHFGRSVKDPSLVPGFLEVMDRNHIAVNVNLDGQLGDEWHDYVRPLWPEHKSRFVMFVHINWEGSGDPDDPATWEMHRPEFPRRIAHLLEEAKQRGCSGLKFFKQFGVGLKNPDGTLVKIDDRRWDPIWEACGRLGMPILIHTSDPAAFFEPLDKNNERWSELQYHPDWHFAGEEYPSREELLAARNRVIERHPKTIFIGAHVANNPENLAEVGKWLDRYPNLYAETAARIGELGRQPYTARRFFVKYADRILLGTDGPFWDTGLQKYWRLLETYDEYFSYGDEDIHPGQGFWRIYGLGLPDDVLRKVYYANAARIIPGVRERLDSMHKDLEH